LNPFLQFLMQMLQRYRQQQMQQQPSQQQNPGAQANMAREQQILRGRPPSGFGFGRLGGLGAGEGTPQAQAALRWLQQNYWGNPGGSGFNNPPAGQWGNTYGTVATNNGQQIGPAMGMGQGQNAFGYREVDPNSQLARMDAMFSGEGRTPGAGGGDFGWANVGGGGSVGPGEVQAV
jgi:hypothetical protein